ncbi:hypothetical protein HV134_06165 [Citrobacter freundii]|nr:hypothetical protein [Citrobacter freundii]
MMSLWDALRMNMMISYQELVRTFPNARCVAHYALPEESLKQAVTLTNVTCESPTARQE